MSDALLHLLVSFGVIYTVTESAIFAGPRIYLASKSVLLETLLYCASCTGFWAGAVVYLAEVAEAGRWSGSVPFDAALAGFLVIGAVNVLRVFGDFLQGAHERERDIIEAWRSYRRSLDS